MKTPEQYLADCHVWPHDYYPYDEVLSKADALLALAAALADCERYKDMLVGAIRRSTLPPLPGTTSSPHPMKE